MGDKNNRDAELPVGERPGDIINRIILDLRDSSSDNTGRPIPSLIPVPNQQ